MKSPLLDQVVHAVLYEGYILYPYRASSKKNRRERFTFGRIYPRDYSSAQGGVEPYIQQTECLVRPTGGAPNLEVAVRFLQPLWREIGNWRLGEDESFRAEREMVIDGVLHQSWQEAVEREVILEIKFAEAASASANISFPAASVIEPFPAGSKMTALRRRQEKIEGRVEVEAARLSSDLFKITVRVINLSAVTAGAECADQDAVLMRTFASSHVILHAVDAEFISLLDPPSEFREFANQCKNVGTWPVLVGDEAKAERTTMLSSPIILYDYPKVAPESAGNFYDGTEIDEMLTLRVLTMTDGEKMEMRHVDEHARRILERTERTGAEDLMRMHGTLREVKAAEDFFNATTPIQHVEINGQKVCVGSNVRVHPKSRADAIDMMIDGKAAQIEAIEQDAEGKIHLALVLHDDPGRDLGLARQPGHRFFYSVEEVEPLEEAPQ